MNLKNTRFLWTAFPSVEEKKTLNKQEREQKYLTHDTYLHLEFQTPLSAATGNRAGVHPNVII